ncbi:hypothetical protein LSAT2_032958 [Lamellibrachia satsuma]|nr:hypothetical protein LSAT2_032958 [Lamellibrachia satsuma]
MSLYPDKGYWKKPDLVCYVKVQQPVPSKGHSWDAVALWLGHRTLNRENPGSNNLAVKLWQFRSPHFATVHNCINDLSTPSFERKAALEGDCHGVNSTPKTPTARGGTAVGGRVGGHCGCQGTEGGGGYVMGEALATPSWNHDVIEAKQGTDVDISCTVSGLNALGVVRIFKSNKDKRYPISDNDQPKTPFVETGRYTANYEYDSTSKVGVVRLQLNGARVEDSGRIGCRRLGDSNDQNIGYVQLKILAPVLELYIEHVEPDDSRRKMHSSDTIDLIDHETHGVVCRAIADTATMKMQITVDGVDRTDMFVPVVEEEVVGSGGLSTVRKEMNLANPGSSLLWQYGDSKEKIENYQQDSKLRSAEEATNSFGTSEESVVLRRHLRNDQCPCSAAVRKHNPSYTHSKPAKDVRNRNTGATVAPRWTLLHEYC